MKLDCLHTPRNATLAIVALISLACVLMATLMWPGLPVNPHLQSRMAFVANHTVLWQLSWLVWTCSAFALFVFALVLRRYIPTSTYRLAGVVLIALGVLPDLAAQLLYTQILPLLIHQPHEYALVETLAQSLTGILANSLYCSGGLLLNWLLLRNSSLPRGPILFGLPSWLIGFGLSIAIAIDAMPSAALFTAVSMCWNLAWMLLLAWKVWIPTVQHEVYVNAD